MRTRSPKCDAEGPRRSLRGRPEDDLRGNRAPHRAAVDELRNSRAVGKEVETMRAQRGEHLAAPSKDERDARAAYPFTDVAAIDEPKREYPRLPVRTHRERLRHNGERSFPRRGRGRRRRPGGGRAPSCPPAVASRGGRAPDGRPASPSPAIFAVSRSEAVACGARRDRRGRACNQPAAPRAALIRGLPWRVRAKPARVTETTSGRAPGFRTEMDAADAPFISRCNGLTPRAAAGAAAGFPPAAAPFGMRAAAMIAATPSDFTGRSPCT